MKFIKTLMTLLALFVALTSVSATTMLVQKDSGYNSGSSMVYLSNTGFNEAKVHTSYKYEKEGTPMPMMNTMGPSFGHVAQVTATVEGHACCPKSTVSMFTYGYQAKETVLVNAAFGAHLQNCYQ